MRLGTANRELFGKFPRFVGSPRQFMVYDMDGMELFLESNYEKNNMYSRIGYIAQEGKTIVDKISLDFDGPEFKCVKCGEVYKSNHPTCDECSGDVEGIGEGDDAQTIRRMRNDRDFANQILGDVVSDVRRFAEFLKDRQIPTIGIFTGWGFHVHTLYKPRVEPSQELRTTALKWRDELDLHSMDKVPIGDSKRLMRIANCARMTEDGEHCNLYTVPWTLKEMQEITIRDLLTESFDGRKIESPKYDRPEMRIYPEVNGGSTSEPEEQFGVNEINLKEIEDENLTDMLEMLLQMPCMVERITQRDPRHPIRMNCAVMLFNRGFSPREVHDLFERLRWVDWDSDTTMYYLEQIWDEKYREMSCANLIERGFCVFNEENRGTCETYQYEGGTCWY
jgi:hypothetical protein